MKLVMTTRNEIDEVGIEEIARDLGVSVADALKGAIHEKFQQLYNQLIEGNPEATKHSHLTWEIHYE